MNKVLYIGGFEMPDKNAAAQRVLSIAKALRLSGFDVNFLGITKSDEYEGMVEGFRYEAKKYPSSLFQWIKHSLGVGLIDFIKTINPDYIITYNCPSVAQNRLIRFCRKKKKKIIGDITEWYNPTDLIRRLDSTYRMTYSNKHLDGIIVISTYLLSYYSNQKCLQIPPLVDIKESKWERDDKPTSNDGKTRLIYVGSPGKKDRLDLVIQGLVEYSNKMRLDVVGISDYEYNSLYHELISNQKEKEFVCFHGKLPHDKALSLLKKADFQIFFRDNVRSNNAGFPTKLVESFSAGIPVITNKISNVSDYLVDGHNGFMIDSPTEEEICNVLKSVSSLTKEQIATMKLHIDTEKFDFRYYSSDIASFFKSV